MNILVTGGNGRMAKHFKSTDKIKFLTPGREELDLASQDSIDSYLKKQTPINFPAIDGILLNAVGYPPGKIDIFNFNGVTESFLNAAKVNLIATIHLYKRLEHQLKFIALMTTGLDPETELSSPYYRNSKMAVADLLTRLSFSETKIKTLFIHPGHMHDDYTFKQSALQVSKMFENIDKLKHLGHYGIFNKDKMECRELESLISYQTKDIIKL